MPTTTPRRLIIGVDGTWCTADGAHGRGEGNVTNVYRICSSIKIGLVTNTKTGLPISQESYYEPGIGSADDIGSWSRIQAGVFGEGVQDKIRDIYRKCCALNENDEIWLYGFSRGAFIVRAVAGLLTNVGALTASSDAQFKEQYKGLLKIYGSNAKRSTVGMGQVCSSRKNTCLLTLISASDTRLPQTRAKACCQDQVRGRLRHCESSKRPRPI